MVARAIIGFDAHSRYRLSRSAITDGWSCVTSATFVAVAEEGSFTRASGRLHVVQSAVSAGVRALERELGSPLFDRTTHQVALTDAGRALLPEARATLAAAAGRPRGRGGA